MGNKKLKLDFEMEISDIVDLNKSFAAAKCLVCYTGRNRNYSDIGKQKIIDALPSMKNIPVVGRYDIDKDDFGSHDIKVINNGEDIEIVNATIPFGVVPESAKQWFETRIINGVEKECFFTDIVLWKRQHGYEHIAKAEKIKESMEIDASEYVIDQDGYCIVDKFEFEALCLLGEDVEPCFENACVQMYSKEILSDFKLQFSQMLKEFKEMDQSSEKEVDIEKELGGNPMATEEKKPVDTDIEVEINEPAEEIEVEVVEQPETVEEQEIEVETEVDAEVDTEEYSALKSEHEKLVEEFEAYKANHSYANEEFEMLKTFKENKEAEERKADEEALFASFEKRIGGTAEFADLKARASEYAIADLRKECLCIVGLYATGDIEEKEIPEKNGIRFSLENNDEEKPEPYGGLFKKYLNK